MELEPGWPCSGPLLRMAEDAARKLLPGTKIHTNRVQRSESNKGEVFKCVRRGRSFYAGLTRSYLMLPSWLDGHRLRRAMRACVGDAPVGNPMLVRQ